MWLLKCIQNRANETIIPAKKNEQKAAAWSFEGHNYWPPSLSCKTFLSWSEHYIVQTNSTASIRYEFVVHNKSEFGFKSIISENTAQSRSKYVPADWVYLHNFKGNCDSWRNGYAVFMLSVYLINKDVQNRNFFHCSCQIADWSVQIIF